MQDSSPALMTGLKSNAIPFGFAFSGVVRSQQAAYRNPLLVMLFCK